MRETEGCVAGLERVSALERSSTVFRVSFGSLVCTQLRAIENALPEPPAHTMNP